MICSVVGMLLESEPFFAGSYFPPRDGERGARLGFLSVLSGLADIFRRDRQRVRQACAAMVQAIRLDLQGQRRATGGGRTAAAARP